MLTCINWFFNYFAYRPGRDGALRLALHSSDRVIHLRVGMNYDRLTRPSAMKAFQYLLTAVVVIAEWQRAWLLLKLAALTLSAFKYADVASLSKRGTGSKGTVWATYFNYRPMGQLYSLLNMHVLWGHRPIKTSLTVRYSVLFKCVETWT